MLSKSIFIVSLVTIGVASAVAQTHGCEVPAGMTKQQKLPCVRAAGILLDQPALTLSLIHISEPTRPY